MNREEIKLICMKSLNLEVKRVKKVEG